jgi:hypothetical protein
LAAWRWKNMGRLLYALVFAWAGLFNLLAAADRPELYIGMADATPIALYRDFIRGPFVWHAPQIVAAVALAQLGIALLLTRRDAAVQVGLLGAIVFLVAIAPLGAAAAFPATLILAVGAARLIRASYPETLLHEAWLRLTHRHGPRAA